MAISQVRPAEAARTKLPYFDLATHNENDAKNVSEKYHSASIKSTPIVQASSSIIKAFASFVAAVSDLEEIAFIAKYAEAEGATEEPRLAVASVPSASKPRSFTSDHIEVATFDVVESDNKQTDFEIQIVSGDDTPATISASGVSASITEPMPGIFWSVTNMRLISVAFLPNGPALRKWKCCRPAAPCCCQPWTPRPGIAPS